TLASGAERRELRREAGHAELKKALRLVDAGEGVLAEIREVAGRVERVPRPLGEQDLPAAPSLADPRGALDVQPEVGVIPNGRLAAVQSHPDAELDARRPIVLRERLLRGHERFRCSPCVFEDDEELVAPRVDDDAALTLHGLGEEAAVVVEYLRVSVAETLHELRRALDVREDECDRSMRKIRHASLLQRDLGADSGSLAGRAVDVELSAQRGDAIGEAPQAGSAQRIGAADAVVGD